ncbi:MAG TPA: exodeoxyribonuclease VII large subunit [Rikenellaceae bacterium]|nr:exodeoxyribonuclease VII large subunit [Rikenellaceae bacterium]HCZ22123.1 exodeoxyribonuclease VII large subunit [Rikenellaceae bacterium]
MDLNCIDLYELQCLLREGIESFFPDKLWVKAEISSVQVKTNGHCYLELCTNRDGKTIAKAKAVIWRSRYQAVAEYFFESTGSRLSSGMEVLVRVSVSYSELYGLTLTVDEVEPEYTVGAAELQKRKTIERLTAEGLMDRQKSLSAAVLPYSLAVISARDAAGYGDFRKHLEHNEYGFVFHVTLFEASMQGESAPSSISDAIFRVETSGEKYDAVLILRGGGSALDLACFDDYGLCLTIAQCPIPVYTAIGHDRDEHVSDMVAFRSEKTPTALADCFVGALQAEDELISSFGTRLRLAFNSKLSTLNSRLDVLSQRIHSADPRNILSRGYVLVTNDAGVVVKSSSGMKIGERLKLFFEDGSLDVCIVDKEK